MADDDPARISASVRVRGRRFGFTLDGAAARALAAVMTACTLLVALEALAWIAWLIARGV